jgi:hypothetical protein
VGVPVDELERVVAFGLHLRQGEHQRLGP